jgi:hypothetical protein
VMGDGEVAVITTAGERVFRSGQAIEGLTDVVAS